MASTPQQSQGGGGPNITTCGNPKVKLIDGLLGY